MAEREELGKERALRREEQEEHNEVELENFKLLIGFYTEAMK